MFCDTDKQREFSYNQYPQIYKNDGWSTSKQYSSEKLYNQTLQSIVNQSINQSTIYKTLFIQIQHFKSNLYFALIQLLNSSHDYMQNT
ncbi:hypothetical protein PPL_12049 [Heterostelium album PN500]|uniref:Uncharacterized protein n=1 Tax=Heterostelium pallidum (strain ATCC 26659 / Pp 5 / PN500) TaxID=670386 RepID=D3BLJ6_HETP5|nr:hypothetical protein PPL_12049 [Heterostelium album PN500]EFA77447.1 hypothetical protein PPL_12049 [Heterostelium album PN500]|eukprot:XP_020429575.1 hypothetical protein PPL_12049 [Heterostelium album PN500]